MVQAGRTGKAVSGASLITMQLAGMLNLMPRNLGSKLQEIWLSWRLFAGINKDEILYAYVNCLTMGSNIYGVEAARIYFGVLGGDLNLAQPSILAALPNEPIDLNSIAPKSKDRAIIDRAYTLAKSACADWR